MVNWIVAAVGIEIEDLRVFYIGVAHPDGINLREASLLRVVVAVDGVVEAGGRTAVVGGEALVCGAG